MYSPLVTFLKDNLTNLLLAAGAVTWAGYAAFTEQCPLCFLVPSPADTPGKMEMAEKPLPPAQWELVDGISGTRTDLVSHEKSQILILSATWCVPCKQQMRDMKNTQDFDLPMATVMLDSPSVEEIRQIRDQSQFQGPILVAANQRTAQSMQNFRMLPTTLVISKEGKIIGKVEGFCSPEQLDSLLEDSLMADQPSTHDFAQSGELR